MGYWSAGFGSVACFERNVQAALSSKGLPVKDRSRFLLSLALCCLASTGLVRAAQAAPDATRPIQLNVNMPNDATDVPIGDGKCDTDPSTSGNQCSLRAAVQEADFWGPGANINVRVPAGTYTLSIPPSGPDDGSTGDLDVLSDVTFNG